MSNLRFHNRTGSMVTLSDSNKCAERNEPHKEFNNGLVLSNEPLKEDHVFEVRIERKVSSWSGSIEIGLTTYEPAHLDFPSSATNLRRGAWVMSGTSILKDGKSIFDECPDDLDELVEGDIVGVMKSSNGMLHFYINGVDQGSVSEMVTTSAVYAVFDLYGKCTKVSIVEPVNTPSLPSAPIVTRSEETSSSSLPLTPVIDHLQRLKFHRRCGSMVRLSNDNRTAERRKPVDEFNNAVVMTHRPLKDNELFQIQIDELIHKWSGSIEMGVTTHNPETLDFPATMTNMRSGTIMMSGCGILTNGKGSKREYGEFNLDELRVSDRIGLMRKLNGSLHYYINGMDQGVAATSIPSTVFGVVDLYGMTVKVSINDILSTSNSSCRGARSRTPLTQSQASNVSTSANMHPLLFHQRCGDHVTIINAGKTALRPNCLDDFNQAVVLTNRPLLQDEFFQVLIEDVVTKWAGSIEIGVTTHNPRDLDFPTTMTNVRTGTWMMTGNGIMHNGTTIIDVYGHSLDKLKPGDRVGLIVSKHGKLNFFVNGVDQGLAACNVPNGVYGVIDLYGQAAKASILCNSGDGSGPSSYNHHTYQSTSTSPAKRPYSLHLGKEEVGLINESYKSGNATKEGTDPLSQIREERIPFNETPSDPTYLFHKICGKNIKFKCGGNMALRTSTYQDAVLFSSKALEEEGVFEVQIVSSNLRWHGTLMLGLTDFEPLYPHLVPQHALDFHEPFHSWILFANNLYMNGQCVQTDYAPEFWRIKAGDTAALRKEKNGNLYFSMNGEDLGLAAKNLPPYLYVVCDVHGSTDSVRISHCNLPPITVPKGDPLTFHIRHNRNLRLQNDRRSVVRVYGHKHSVVMTNRCLKPGELFEINIDSLDVECEQSLRIGVTPRNPEKWYRSLSDLPFDECSYLFIRDKVLHGKKTLQTKYGPDLNTLQAGQTVGVRIEHSKKLHFFIDGVDQGMAAETISLPCYAFVDLFGQCSQVSFSDIKHLEKAEEENKETVEEKEDADKEIDCCAAKLSNPECKFHLICSRIRTLLFPDGFFLKDGTVCFCEECHESRGDEVYSKKGEPPKDYAQPVGWCRFALKTKDIDCDYEKEWHVAFHGTKLGNVRRILDSRCLLSSGKFGLQRNVMLHKGDNEKETSSSQVIMSPTLLYAASPQFSPATKIKDAGTEKELRFHVAFQVYVRPGSYTTAPISPVAMRDPIDKHFSNSDLEWYTKEGGSTILHGLLIRLAD